MIAIRLMKLVVDSHDVMELFQYSNFECHLHRVMSLFVDTSDC
jgi:hypothetical protein